MEQWSANDERPLPRPSETHYGWWVLAGVIVLIAAAAAGYYYWARQAPPKSNEVALNPQVVAPTPAPAAPAPGPKLQAPAPEAVKALPSLDNSDSLLRSTLAGLIGDQALAKFVFADRIVRRIVATVDNLPRRIAPVRMLPVEPVRGRFPVVDEAGKMSIGPANAARYAPHVKIVESLKARALADFYIGAYPLFQKAYEELGFPGLYFNDRLMAAIDDMLAAPEVTGPIALARPKVLYQYADADLESRSAGQKILIRMGPANAAKVKAKLRELQREITRPRGQ